MKTDTSFDSVLSLIGQLALDDRARLCKHIAEEAPKFHALSFFHSKEEIVSQIIAYLLNPYAQHGQGFLFLKTFLTSLEVPCPGLQSVLVQPEFTLRNGRRIDILIRFTANMIDNVIVIESKSHFAGDQPKQIHDYLSHIRSAYPPTSRRYLFYLKDGTHPSEESIALAEWRAAQVEGICSSKDFLRTMSDWLGRILKEKMASNVRVFIKDFRTFLGADEELAMTVDSGVRNKVMKVIEQAGSALNNDSADFNAILALYALHDHIWPKALDVCMENVQRLLTKRLPGWLIRAAPYFNDGEYYFELVLWKEGRWKMASDRGPNVSVVLASEDRLKTAEHQEGYRGPMYFEMYIRKTQEFSARRAEFSSRNCMVIGPGKKETRRILVNGIEDARSAEAVRYLLTSQGALDIANQIVTFVTDYEDKMDACFGQ